MHGPKPREPAPQSGATGPARGFRGHHIRFPQAEAAAVAGAATVAGATEEQREQARAPHAPRYAVPNPTPGRRYGVVVPWEAAPDWVNARRPEEYGASRTVLALWSMAHADPKNWPCVPCSEWVEWARRLPEELVDHRYRCVVADRMKYYLALHPTILNPDGMCACGCGQVIPAIDPGQHSCTPFGFELEHWTGQAWRAHISLLRWMATGCHTCKTTIETNFTKKGLPLPAPGAWLEMRTPNKGQRPDSAKLRAAVALAAAKQALQTGAAQA